MTNLLLICKFLVTALFLGRLLTEVSLDIQACRVSCCCKIMLCLDSSKPPHPLVAYFQNLQREPGSAADDTSKMGEAIDADPNSIAAGGGGQWSANLLRAASFICDKLQQQTAAFTGSTPELNMCEQETSVPTSRWKKRSFRGM